MPFLGKHPANYYTNLIVESERSCLDLLKKYSIHPPDDADGYKGDTTQTISNVRGGPGGDEPVRVGLITDDKKVAYLSLSRMPKGPGWITGNEGGKTLYGKAGYTASADAIPVYWLPWDIAGAVLSIKIPAKGTRGRGQPDPDRFFTAAINGCSVFFEDSPDSPRVYHCGGSTYKNTADAGALFWRGLVNQLSIIPGRRRKEVNKTDYITKDGVTTTDPMGKTVLTTQAAKDYQTWLEAKHDKALEISEVSPWGCVMGIRDARGDWKFYLQENVTITYYVLKKQFGLFGKTSREKETSKIWNADTQKYVPKLDRQTDEKVKIDRKRQVSRPIGFTEVYPSRKRGVRIQHALPTWSHG